MFAIRKNKKKVFFHHVKAFFRDLFRIKCHWEDDILPKKSPKVGRFTYCTLFFSKLISGTV